MIGFELLLAHLVGDYILQNDWQARNKANPHPGPEPHPQNVWISHAGSTYEDPRLPAQRAWWAARDAWRLGHLACAVHCLLYTLAVAAFTWSWMPWWGYLACFLAHWVMDRFALAGHWMRNVSGQRVFAEKMGPWSTIVVDNTAHLLTLYAIAQFALPR